MNANTNINVLGGILDAMLANLTEHIDKRVEAKVVTLTERIERLETDLKAVEGQLYDLKNAAPTVLREDVNSLMNCQDHDQMENSRRLSALEARLSGEQPTLGVAVMDLQSTEFLEAVCKIIDKHTMGDEFLNPLVTALIDNGEFVDAINEAAREVARSEAEEAVSDHCSDYEHDDIHESSEIDEDAVREVIEEVLNNVTVSLKI